MTRFQTVLYSMAGEGPTLYSGDSLAEAVRSARGVKVGDRTFVAIIDHNKTDLDNPGYVPWEDFAEGEDLALDIDAYLR